MKKILSAIATVAALVAATACHDSYEISMPDNPVTEPTVGNEVPTAVVYEANPGFFDTTNCLNALAANLQRINDLGTDILWIMPVCEPSTDPVAIGSPYSIKNYTAMNPAFGTVDDLKNLVSQAHSLGMKVILDWVANHTGFDNVWVTEHPDWFVRDSTGVIQSPAGWNDVAQLAWNNDSIEPEIAAGMAAAMEYWVTATDIDGFRCDYADGVPSSFWTMLIADLQAMKSDIVMLAETSNVDFYNYGFDMIYDWDSAPTMAKAFSSGKNATTIVQEGQSAWAQVPAGKSILRYVFNHDVLADNSIDSYYGSIDALPAAYVCAAFLNGTPLIYSGMDAENLSGTQSFFTGNYQALTFSSTLTPVYAAINKIFKESAQVRRGRLQNFSNPQVTCFTYTTPDNTLLVAVNVTGSTQKVVTPIAMRYSNVTDMLNGGTVTVPLEIELEPYGYTFLLGD